MSQTKNKRKTFRKLIDQARTMELYNSGMTQGEIAEVEGITQGAVSKRLTSAKEEVAAKRDRRVEEYREIELQRIDHVAMGLWTDVEAGNVAACREMGRLIDLRCKVLGLYTALKDDVSPAKAREIVLRIMTEAHLPPEAIKQLLG